MKKILLALTAVLALSSFALANDEAPAADAHAKPAAKAAKKKTKKAAEHKDEHHEEHKEGEAPKAE
jgi:Ni/Co efflux regulator RcnB